MRHIKEIRPMVEEVRQRIVETMQERGISEVQFIPSEEEWLEQNPDKYEEEYYAHRDEVCPYIVHFDKYGCGHEYLVTKVLLVGKDYLGSPLFKLECEASEIGNDTFFETDVYDMTWVYEMLEKALELDSEPEKVYVFTAEQAYDGEVADVVVRTFRKKEAAHEFMHKFIHDGGEESIEEYVKRKGWSVEMEDPDLYMACEDGYYSTDHIEITITECNIE